MVEPTATQRMLLTNRVQTNTVAWPQGGRQVLVPSWSQQAAPHSLIVDSAPFLNMEEIYPKHHLNLPRHELKKESPVHHLPLVFNGIASIVLFFPSLCFLPSHLHNFKYILITHSVPRHDKKETNQLSPVKKRVKENSPPHQQRYNRAHVSPQYHQSSNHINYYTNSGNSSNNANNINNHGHQLQHHQNTSSSQLITQPHTSYSNTNNNSMPISHSSSHNSLKPPQVVSAKTEIHCFYSVTCYHRILN